MPTFITPEFLLSATIALAPILLWVGRVQSRVSRSEEDIKLFIDRMTKHVADDAVAHERIAKIEGQLDIAIGILERLDESK